MKTPMALWKKIYIFLAVTIILALNIFVLVYAVRAKEGTTLTMLRLLMLRSTAYWASKRTSWTK